MRSLVFLLIFGNIVVFALSAGWIGAGTGDAVVVSTESHQPLSPDRIRIVSRGEPPHAPPPTLQCIEWRALSAVQADALEAAAAGQKNLALLREETSTAVSSHRVVIAVAKGGQAAAEKKAAELKKLGVKDFRLSKTGDGEAWAIELGTYDSDTRASQALADFRKLGARSAQLDTNGASSAQYRVRANGLPETLAPLRKVAEVGTPQPCPPDAAASAAREPAAAPSMVSADAAPEAPAAAAVATGSPKP